MILGIISYLGKRNKRLTTVSTCQRYVTILADSAVSYEEKMLNRRKNRAITRCRYYELGLEGEFEERYHLA